MCIRDRILQPDYATCRPQLCISNHLAPRRSATYRTVAHPQFTDRVAGSLLLCYAQPLSRLTAITRDQIVRDPERTTIRFGTADIVVPEPLAGLLGDLLDTPPAYVGVGAPAASRWLFPGQQAARPLTPARLGARLNKLGIDARAGR